jgi:putative DNA primase/helicase
MSAADDLIAALGGNPRSGMACCPAHDDANPSLHITEVNGRVLFYCFAGCSQQAVLDRLRDKGLWPVGRSSSKSALTRRHWSDEQKREYALRILADTRVLHGRGAAEQFLPEYFRRRGIAKVPATALLALPWGENFLTCPRLVSEDPGMVFEVTDGTQVLGCAVTWLNAEATAKREQEPQRQFWGRVGGGYIKLYPGGLEPETLIIAEGVETALAYAQLAGIETAIAALSATNLPRITPPPADAYVIAADNDKPGVRGARALALKLVRDGRRVRIAMPPRVGTDWNDVLLERRMCDGEEQEEAKRRTGSD